MTVAELEHLDSLGEYLPPIQVSLLEKCAFWLDDMLADRGPMLIPAIRDEARRVGFSVTSNLLWQASKLIEVRTIPARGPHARWVPRDHPDAHLEEQGQRRCVACDVVYLVAAFPPPPPHGHAQHTCRACAADREAARHQRRQAAARAAARPTTPSPSFDAAARAAILDRVRSLHGAEPTESAEVVGLPRRAATTDAQLVAA